MMTDQEVAFARERSSRNLRPLVERYLPSVYASAYRQTGDDGQATEVTRAVFVALANRAKSLRRKTVLAGWLFRATRFGCTKLLGRKKRRDQVPSSNEKPLNEVAPNVLRWTEITPELDEALDPLSPALRDALLMRMLPECSWEQSAQILGTTEKRARKRAQRGVEKLAKRLRKRVGPVEGEALALALATEGCAAPVPEGLSAEILALVEEGQGTRPTLELARRTLRAIFWWRWRRRCRIAARCLGVFLILATIAGLYLASLWRSGHLMAWLITASALRDARKVPGLDQAARPWPAIPPLAIAPKTFQTPADLYQTTNIWLAQLKFSAEQWKALQPKRVPPVPRIVQPDGEVLLRNPKAQRTGLAGVLGYDFDWTQADLELAGLAFPKVRARLKGNGTYLLSLYGWKRSFKVDLKKSSQSLGGIDDINFTNLIDDRSYMSDALAYELFRQAGVPAPRTAYAWLSVSVAGKWERKPLGLYLLLENIGGTFASERFGRRNTPLFKPVTYRLFQDLGEDWSAYAAIYDLKTKATDEQRRRVIEFSHFVSRATNPEFAQRLGEYLDLDEFARFLACLVLLSSYDGLLSDGQNFYVYLNRNSNKFGFIPWDLDHAWGGFYLVGSRKEREKASIWHPWMGQNRFLQRVLAVEEFRQIYRARLEDLLTRLFVPDRLAQRIDEVARAIRSPIAAESSLRLEWFDIAVGGRAAASRSPTGNAKGPNRPVHQLKRFIEARAISVREQLDGKSDGVIPNWRQGR